LQRFDVRPANPDAIFSTLSGGNAQKVVLARWMNHQPTVIILNDPTAAVDIGARREIHQRLRTAAAEGAIVVLISSDMEEIEQVCDRAAVVRAGQISTILSRSDISVAALTRYAYESN
jgi:ABC-type sugar transport system ATPase subunit